MSMICTRYNIKRGHLPSHIYSSIISTRSHVDFARSSTFLKRQYAVEISPNLPTAGCPSGTLSLPSKPRFNDVGVQQLSSHVHPQVFSRTPVPPPQDRIQLSKNHLEKHQLLGRNQEITEPIAFDLPKLHGSALDEHFHKLGKDASEPYFHHAVQYADLELPPTPKKWARRSGWTKYLPDGTCEPVEAPQEEMLTFDTEVMWKESSFAVMACAASGTSWYAWLSPWLLGESETDKHLIPLGNAGQARIVIGHNVGYDRARIAEEYDIKQSKNFFIDTMSLHVAVNGMCSRQRPTWMKHKKNRDLREKVANESSSPDLAMLLESGVLSEEEEELWVARSSINSLRDVAKFHCNVTIDKEQRDQFGELDRGGVRQKLDELLDYCAGDVVITHRVYKKVFPEFIKVCPHPVSFGALRHLSSVILPVDRSWESYLANAEGTYMKLSKAVEQRLIGLADSALQLKGDPAAYSKDDWLSQLDWSGQAVKMVKGKKKNEPPRPAARQKKPGMPQWYKDLFASNDAKMNLTVRTRIAPLLLRLSWDGYPLIWSDKYGWTFKIPLDSALGYRARAVVRCDMSDEKNLTIRDDRQHQYFKLPHVGGPQAICATPMAKSYLQYFEKGILSSEYSYAKEALEMNASCSYWISARDRIKSQMVVYEDEAIGVKRTPSSKGIGYILPQVIPMGTITRRAVENTWLTASNAKSNRVGSELKSMIRAPSGYCFVGADVDSQELWIASLIGDAQFGIHGGNAIGFMTLEGTKAAGTDLHSKTAKILGISRNDAKVFNYGRIYGAGPKFASRLLQQSNPNLSEQQTLEIAMRLYKETKGSKTTRKVLSDRPFWRGGTESLVFNTLEEFAEQERPRTPVLGAGITEALMRRFVNKGGFMTSRINWAIQSSGVDYLHLLIISMDYLIRRFHLDARLAISVHDEIRYLVKEEDKYRGAMALQVANLWTRAMFSQQMGIDDLPQGCAYFSAVDIDHVLRKEVDMDCVTPSNPDKIPHGESLSIGQLLEKGSSAFLDPEIVPHNPIALEQYEYIPRIPVMAALSENVDLGFLKAQISNSDQELSKIVKEAVRKAGTATKSSTTATLRNSRVGVSPECAQLMDMPYIHLQGWSWDQSSELGQEHKTKEWMRPHVQRLASRA